MCVCAYVRVCACAAGVADRRGESGIGRARPGRSGAGMRARLPAGGLRTSFVKGLECLLEEFELDLAGREVIRNLRVEYNG